MSNLEPEDIELLEKFRNEETRNYAFNLIVRKYQQRVYWHVRKLVISHDDADDVTQTTFIKVWKGLSAFREDSKLFTWIYRIATNESLTLLSQKKRRFLVPLVDVEHELSNKIMDDNNFNGNQIQKKLQLAILTLPEKQRVVFNLKYFEEMKYEQMAEVLDTSVGALKASYHHAVKKVEKYFESN